MSNQTPQYSQENPQENVQPTFDARTFRRALGNFATGVTVVTAQNSNGDIAGVTANSFNSVSIDPPLILWSIDKNAHSYNIFNIATHFAVNILASDQIDMSNRFAQRGEDKFSGIDWSEGAGRAPILKNCAATFQCKNYQQVDAGDHWILIGEVVKFDDAGRAPLCFHQGSYGMIVDHPGSKKSDELMRAETMQHGRLSENVLYLLFQAVRAYQESYLPKQEALGLNTIESRCLLIISDLPGISIEKIQHISDMQIDEIKTATSNLAARGFIEIYQNAYNLTVKGLEKAETYWNLSNAHANKVLQNLTTEEVAAFKNTLRMIEGG